MEEILQEITPEQFAFMSQNTGVSEEEMAQVVEESSEVQNG